MLARAEGTCRANTELFFTRSLGTLRENTPPLLHICHFPSLRSQVCSSLSCASVSDHDHCEWTLSVWLKKQFTRKTSHRVAERRRWQTSSFHVTVRSEVCQLVKGCQQRYRQVAAHGAHIATLAARMDGMRYHLDQVGVRLHAVETQIGRSGTSGGYGKFTLSKEMMLESFNGTVGMKCTDWEFKMSGSRKRRTMWTRTGLTGSQCSEDGSDKQETTRGLRGTCSQR